MSFLIGIAKDLIQPYNMIQFSYWDHERDIFPTFENYKSGRYEDVVGMYLAKIGWINDGSEPPTVAVKGDLIMYREREK